MLKGMNSEKLIALVIALITVLYLAAPAFAEGEAAPDSGAPVEEKAEEKAGKKAEENAGRLRRVIVTAAG